MDLGAAGAAITVLESDSNHDWKVQKQMGFARIAQRRYSEAQTHLDKALLLDPGDSYQALILRLNRANCLLQQEQFGLFAQESDALKAPLVRYPMLEEWLLLLNAESSCL
jgi:predicted Zn-dependent protease